MARLTARERASLPDRAFAYVDSTGRRRLPIHDVSVRIGVHTGRPTLTESGYVGLSVHTVARICSVAHGGQIVVSSRTQLGCDPLPDGVRLRSLGAHHLAGLPGEEHLFQVVAEGLRSRFAPLRIRL